MADARRMLNKRAEFVDKNLEKTYYDEQVTGAKKYIRFVIFFAALAFFVISIFDYSYNDDFYTFLRSAIARGIVFLVALICFVVMKRTKSSAVISVCMSTFPVFLTAAYIYILAQQGAQGFVSQAMAIMVILFCTTLLPLRWLHFLIMDLLIAGIFLAAAPFYINNLQWDTYTEIFIYLFLMLIFTATTQYRLNFTQRLRFIRERQLETQSVTDGLTGLYNRLWFDKILAEWCGDENRKVFSLILMDVDDFKVVNDTYGHLEGDRILIEGTNAIRENVRKKDLFARWGGEEFVLLLPDTRIKEAAELAERIRVMFSEHEFEKIGRVTSSYGVVEYREGESAEAIIKRADKQLYLAKNSGKNAVFSED